MGKETGISWTDHTFNGWWGCTEVSPGCQHCYARTLSERWGFEIWGKYAPRRLMTDKHWAEPLAWEKQSAAEGRQHMVFTSSMADVFEDHPDLVAPRARLFALMEQTPHLTWQMLTKRPENVLAMVPPTWTFTHRHSSLTEGVWPHNVWMMTSVENQEQANLRLPFALEVMQRTRCPLLGISAEPLLGPVSFNFVPPLRAERCAQLLRANYSAAEAAALAVRYKRVVQALWTDYGYVSRLAKAGLGEGSGGLDALMRINWIITGGESGPRHRYMDPRWATSIRDQCLQYDVAFFHKQNGGATPKAAGKLLDGREWCEFPAVRPAAELALP